MISIDNVRLYERLTQITNKTPKTSQSKPRELLNNTSYNSKFHLKQILDKNQRIAHKIEKM